jgi:fumarate hydratase subunit alpha
MREISSERITSEVRRLCIESNRILPEDLEQRIRAAAETETSPVGKSILADLGANMDAARERDLPICQDTGMAVVFAEVGQDVHIAGEPFEEAVNEGVRQGYRDGMLRCSVAADPIRRGNTGDNTPAVIHTRLVPGDRLRLTVAPKGFGSENMSRLKMFTPAASEDDLIDFVAETVKIAGGRPCPPVVVGVGIGGDFELCALLAKEALCRPVSLRNADPFYAELENRMLQAVNSLNVGPQGFGGSTTAFAVNIEQYPTHIAGLPLAVNMGCHVTRHKFAII